MVRSNRKLLSSLLILALFMALIPTLLPGAAQAVGETGTTGIWRWTVLADGTLSITGCTAASGDLTLPESLNTGSGPVSVTRIESNAFKSSNPIFFPSQIASFVMPDSVTSVGDSAFYGCRNLTSVTLSQNLQTIGASAFYNCSALTGVVIPDSTESIGSAAFSNCTGLTGVTLPDNVNFIAIPENLFMGDYNLKTVNIASLNHIQSIGSQAFQDCGLENVSLPDSITTIGESAFDACRDLESVTLPENDSFTVIPNHLFSECESLQNIIIPASVTSIGECAFLDCYALQNIAIPENVASIGSLAFTSCSAIDAITVDPGNTHFSSENGVLYNADQSELICCPAGWSGSLNIPEGVLHINDHAFYQCSGLETVHLPDSVESIGDFAFNQCTDLMEINIPENVASIGAYTFGNCGSLLTVDLPEDLASIGNSAFLGCESLGRIVIPENASSIGDNAFAFCSDLKKAVILGGSTVLGSDVFLYTDIAHGGIYGCSGSPAQTYATAHSTPFYVVCTVSFETGGGSAVPDIYAGEGEFLSTPADPTLAGFDFEGWYKDPDCTDDWVFSSDTVTGDTILCAKWVPIVTSTIVNLAAVPGITPPARGEAPAAVIEETAQYTGSISWNPADDPFEPNTVYIATIALTPKDGYTLTGVPENFFTVAGANSVSNDADSGVITAVFPATEPVRSAVISPATVVFELDEPDDVRTMILDWGDAQAVTDVVYGINYLASPDDFTVDENTLTITEEYLSGLRLANGDSVELAVCFDRGDDALLTIEAEQNYLPGSDASLNDLMVNGMTVSNFDENQFAYDMELPYDTRPGSAAARVSAQAADPQALVNITQAAALPGDAIVEVTAEDLNTTQTYTIHFSLGEAPEPEYPLTITAGTGGSITDGSSGNYAAGTVLPIAASANNDYSFHQWTSSGGGTFVNADSAVTTFTMPAEAVTITASFTYNGSSDGDGDDGGNGSGGGGGGGSSSGNNSSAEQPPAETPRTETTLSGNSATATTTAAAVYSNGRASAAVTQAQVSDAVHAAADAAAQQRNNTAAIVEIYVEAPADTAAVEVNLPQNALGSLVDAHTDALRISTPVAALTFDSQALSTIAGAAAGDIQITASAVNVASLSPETQQLVGDRPVFNFSVTSGGKTISQFGGNVSVAIPYTPKPGEDINAIVIYYINAEGQPEIVSNCVYDPATGTVAFDTTHFSRYAVGYHKVNFLDVPSGAWYSQAVGFIAAREITTGTGGGNYSPDAQLTRGEFLVMLLKTYEIAPDTEPAHNFSDAGNSYYTGYLATAKRLGITGGTGDNLFAPDKAITRQEMFTLLYNALNLVGDLPEGNSGKHLSAFSDSGQVASWAKEAVTLFVEKGILSGDGARIEPAATTTRAEMAQVLYKLLLNSSRPQTV